MKQSYCLYLRKSRKDMDAEAHGEGETLARHEKALLHTAKQMNLPIGAIYKEIVSGETIAARPVMQQLLREVEQGLWAGCLVMEIERLARGDTRDQGYVAEAFTYSNTKIITPMKTYDPCDPSDQEYFEFSLFMSRREYKTINRRLEAGKQASFEEGKYLGNIAPYGWQRYKLSKQKGFSLIPDEKEAPILKMLYMWAAYGPEGVPIGTSLISARLDEMGVKPRKGDRWSPAAVREILKNETNIGYVRRFRRQTKKEIKNGVVTKTRPNNTSYQTVKGLHAAQIDAEVFRLANKNIGNGAPRVPSSYEIKNPLSGLIYCPFCGRIMTRRITKVKSGYDFLHCSTPHCPTVGAALPLVERILIEQLQNWLHGYEMDSAGKESTYAEERKIKENLLTDLITDKNTLLTQRSNLYDLLEQGIYTTEVFLERQKTAETKLTVLSNKISVLEKELKYEAKKEQDKVNFAPKCKYLIENYVTLTVVAKNELLKELIDKITYTKTERNKKGQVNVPSFKLDIYPKVPKDGA